MLVVGVFLDHASNLFLFVLVFFLSWPIGQATDDQMRNHLMDYVFLFHPPKSGPEIEIQINKNITINDYVYNDLPIDYNGKEVRVGLGADELRYKPPFM